MIVADNYHYQDQSEWSARGVFESLEDAIAECKRIVLASLAHCGSLSDYKSFGYDPFNVSEGVEAPTVLFSAWTYAGEVARAAGSPSAA